MVRFFLVRHGETAANRDGILQGHMDVPLSDVGKTQAEEVGLALLRFRFDVVYSSDLSRARETAEAIMKGRSCPWVLEPCLRETDVGSLSGLGSLRRRELYPDYYLAREKDPLHTPYPGGGESRFVFHRRVRDCLSRIYRESVSKGYLDVCLVTHGGVINAVGSMAKGGVPWPNRSPDNCSLTVVSVEGDKLDVIAVNLRPSDCEGIPMK